MSQLRWRKSVVGQFEKPDPLAVSAPNCTSARKSGWSLKLPQSHARN